MGFICHKKLNLACVRILLIGDHPNWGMVQDLILRLILMYVLDRGCSERIIRRAEYIVFSFCYLYRQLGILLAQIYRIGHFGSYKFVIHKFLRIRRPVMTSQLLRSYVELLISCLQTAFFSEKHF